MSDLTKARANSSDTDSANNESFEDVPQDILVDNYIGRQSNDDVSQDQPGDEESFNEPLEKSQSRLSRVRTQMSFFNPRWKSARIELGLEILKIYVIMAVLLLGIFSVYWGSMFDRNSRLRNLKMLLVVDDDVAINGVSVGDSITEFIGTPFARNYGEWSVHNYSSYSDIALKNNNTIQEQVDEDIHHQRYWSSIYVRKNATGNFYQALQLGNSSYSTLNNTVLVIYETGRDFINMNTYVTPNIIKIQEEWLSTMLQGLVASLVESLSTEEKSNIFSNADNLKLVTTPLNFEFIDRIPFTDPVLVAPSQVGLIYMIIITFVGVGFFQGVHQKVYLQGLKFHHFIMYRLFASMISYFWLSLMYSLVTLAMQVDFTKAFGRSGFLVYWMTSYMTMWIVGSVNEVMAMWFVLYYPPLMGFWLLFWVIINISPTFTPLALSPKVFRYGYALPLHNSYEISKVIFFNTFKGQLGRNYGILTAWCIIMIALFVGTCYYFEKVMLERKRVEKANQGR